jgi:hypothetical protein
MHGFDATVSPAADNFSGPWYRAMNRYHWFVLAVAAMGWLFDTMDQQLFVLARPAPTRRPPTASAPRGPRPAATPPPSS